MESEQLNEKDAEGRLQQTHIRTRIQTAKGMLLAGKW